MVPYFIINLKTMDPTSKEYIHTLTSLKEELQALKSEQNKLRLQISKLFEENVQLSNELKETIQIRLQQSFDSDTVSLEHRLQKALASKNAAIEMWQIALNELEKQENLLLGKKSIIATERNEVEKQINQLKENYTKGLNILSEELSNLRAEVSRLKHKLEVKTTELDECRKSLDFFTDEVNLNKNVIAELSSAKCEMTEKISFLQSALSESEKSLTLSKDDNTCLKAEVEKLLLSTSELKEENKKLKSKVLMCEKDAKESLLTAQEAVLQKKKMTYREEKYLKDIELLKSSTDFEIEKVSMRFKAEIKEVQKQAAEKIQSLLEEIQLLHKENSEKQSMFERAAREKQALESKLELLLSENSDGISISASAFDDMCRRLTMAERARDEFELKVSSLESTLRELQTSKDQELQYLRSEQISIKEKYQKAFNDFNRASSDQIKLCNEVAKFKKRCSELEKELKCTNIRFTNELSTKEDDFKNKEKMLCAQLNSMEDHYKGVCNEMQKLLESEISISNKWKGELEDFLSKSEKEISELCRDILYLKKTNSELINIINQKNLLSPIRTLYTTDHYTSVMKDH